MQKQVFIYLLGVLFWVALAHSAALSRNFADDDSDAEEDQMLQGRLVFNHDHDLNFDSMSRLLARRIMLKRKELSVERRQSSDFTKEQRTFQEEMLDAHNKYRARHCAPPLKLDHRLSRSAQKYAEHLADINQMVHSHTKGLGENLFTEWSSDQITIINGAEPTDAWYSEIHQYNFDNPDYQPGTGHFTQLVWKNSRKLGAGFAITPDGQNLYAVAQYMPPGNYLGEFKENVSPANC